MAEMNELVAAVKKHASENYNKDGWDYVVECYGDEEIAEIIGNARNEGGAIARVKRVVRILAERRHEVRSEIFALLLAVLLSLGSIACSSVDAQTAPMPKWDVNFVCSGDFYVVSNVEALTPDSARYMARPMAERTCNTVGLTTIHFGSASRMK